MSSYYPKKTPSTGASTRIPLSQTPMQYYSPESYHATPSRYQGAGLPKKQLLFSTGAKNEAPRQQIVGTGSLQAVEDIESYRMLAEKSEMKAFSEIIDRLIVKRGDLNDQEVTVVKEELDAKSSMILMIFRFFLQSNEYQFFIRRLKNVVMTKASLRQLSSSTPH